MQSEELFTLASSPESVGIPSGAILRFLQRIDSERICMHGFLLARHNRIAAEGYWSPWSACLPDGVAPRPLIESVDLLHSKGQHLWGDVK